MKLESILFFGFTAVTFASATINTDLPINDDLQAEYAACYAPDGLCTALAAATAAGKGIIGAPTGGSTNEHAKRAEDFLLNAINEAETGNVSKTKRSADPRWRLCTLRGSICLKTKRAANAIESILAEPLEKTKRSAEPWRLCTLRGSICLKHKRAAEALLDAAREIDSTLPAE